MMNTSDRLVVTKNSKIIYKGAVYPYRYTVAPIASESLREKLLIEVLTVESYPLPGMNSEETVEEVLGLKKGVVAKLKKTPIPGAPWKIEIGVALVYLDSTGQTADEMPIESSDVQRLQCVCNDIGYEPNADRRRRFEHFRSLYNYYTPEALAARHRLDYHLADAHNWMLIRPSERVSWTNDAFSFNDLRFAKMKAGNWAAAIEAHLALHAALTTPRYRDAILPTLRSTISVFERGRTEGDTSRLAELEYKSHEELIERYGRWTDISHLPEARYYLTQRHMKRSPALRISMRGFFDREA